MTTNTEIKSVAEIKTNIQRATEDNWRQDIGHYIGLYISDLRAYAEQLESRLEIDPDHSYDGIECRNKTIDMLEDYRVSAEERIQKLEREKQELEAKLVETGWLIELRGPAAALWLMVDGNVTATASKALRFARKEDAEGFLEIFLTAKFGDDVVSVYKRRLAPECYFVSQHMWD